MSPSRAAEQRFNLYRSAMVGQSVKSEVFFGKPQRRPTLQQTLWVLELTNIPLLEMKICTMEACRLHSLTADHFRQPKLHLWCRKNDIERLFNEWNKYGHSSSLNQSILYINTVLRKSKNISMLTLPWKKWFKSSKNLRSYVLCCCNEKKRHSTQALPEKSGHSLKYNAPDMITRWVPKRKIEISKLSTSYAVTITGDTNESKCWEKEVRERKT